MLFVRLGRAVRPFVLFLVLAILPCVPGLWAQTITFKVATVAPEKSPYGDALHKLAAEWSRITGGRLKMVFYFNGVAGGEFDIVSKIRLGQLQGAVVSQMGLSFIDRRTNVLSAPALIKDNAQLDYVLPRMIPDFDKYLSEKKFVPVAYSRAGWLRFFSKSDQIRTPGQVMVRKLGISGSEKEFFEAFKEMHYNVVPVEVNESLSALNTGLCDTTFSSPLVVGAFQWFGIAKYMLDQKISPFIGAIIFDEKAWNRIPAEFRAPMIEAAKKIAAEDINGSMDKLEQSAIDIMTSYGLVSLKPTSEESKDWNDQMAKYLPLVPNEVFDKPTLQKVRDILATYPGTKK